MANKRGDWMPRGRQRLYTLVTETTVPYIDKNLARFGMGDSTPLGIWYKQKFSAEGYDPYVTAYAAWINPETRTPVDIAAMKAAEDVFIPCYRELYKLMKANPLVTNVDLEAMGFPTRSSNERTPSPIADDAPEFSFTPLVGHRVEISYYTRGGAHKKSKPKGQHGVEIRWAFSETPVEDTGELLNSVFDTASPYIFTFNGKDQGRDVYLAMRWENTRGEKGPWSQIETVAVP